MGFYRQRTKCQFLCSQCLPPNSCSQRAQLLQPVQPTPATQPAASSCSQCLPPNPAASAASYCTQLLQGQAQTHLCARFARADGGAAAVALHPADDGVAYPVAVWVYGF